MLVLLLKLLLKEKKETVPAALPAPLD